MVQFRRNLAAILLAGFAAASHGQGSPFMRMQKPTATQEVLQTKAREYYPGNGQGPVVWLVGVAHIGEFDYYKQLQTLLNQQQIVLYEGVTRNGVDPVKAADASAKSTYKTMSDALKLQFQLFGINYTRPGFRNADLSWDELQAIEAKYPEAKKSGMSLSTIGNLLNADSAQGKQLVSAMSMIKDDPSSVEAMHLGMIEALSDPTLIDRTLSPSLNDVLIKSRNAKVLKALKAEIARKPRSIAIFFGAGHMADMEKHLIGDLGYVGGHDQWFTAIQGDSKKVTSSSGQMMLQMMRAAFKAKKPGG